MCNCAFKTKAAKLIFVINLLRRNMNKIGDINMADKPNFTNHTGDDYESGILKTKNPCDFCGSQRCYPEYCDVLHPELKQMCDLMCPEPESINKRIKEITSQQLEQILKDHCNKYKYVFNGFYHEEKPNWLVLSFGQKRKNEYGRINVENACYCMTLNNDYIFINVMRGLTKQLLGRRIIDIENIKKDWYL
jgi:hypothetical protein